MPFSYVGSSADDYAKKDVYSFIGEVKINRLDFNAGTKSPVVGSDVSAQFSVGMYKQ